MELPQECINDLSKDGFDWIALRPLYMRSKRSKLAIFHPFWLIVAIYSYFASFVIILAILSVTVQQYWSAAHLFCIMRPRWGDVNTVTKYGDCGISINVLYVRPERSNLDFCDLFGLISQKQCMLWPKYLWNTCRKSYMIIQLTSYM